MIVATPSAVAESDKFNELLGPDRWVVLRTEIWHSGSDGSE